MSKIKCILCDGHEETTKTLNELKEEGHNLSMNLLSITADRCGIYTIFYNDVFDGRGNGDL
jgi:hypothetical protein